MPPLSWLAFVPPFVVVIATLLLGQIHLSLAIGILAAALVAAGGVPTEAFSIGSTALWRTITNIDNIYLYGFLLSIGFLVSLFTATGFAISFAHAVSRKIRSQRAAKYATMLVSFLMLIDDYLTILTTGCVMGPLIDQFRIAREKFAFLIHSFAGPIVILVPISSWVATIMAYMDEAGVATPPAIHNTVRIAADPFFIYLKSIPFMLYSLLIVVAVWFIVHYQISFGPMRHYEEEATLKEPPSRPGHIHANMHDLLIPLTVLIGGIALGLPCAGGYWLFGGAHSLMDSIKYTEHPFLIMLLAVLASITVTIIQALIQQILSYNHIILVLSEGFKLMASSIIMVFLASTLSGLLANHVGTGQYIAFLLADAVSFAFLPVMFFLISLVCTIATGSAWSNFALILPIAIPMLTTLSGLSVPLDPQELPLLLPVLGAIFSGSVCGDQISPLSDTTTMTVTSTRTRIATHTYTQIFYILPLIASCTLGYTIMGLLIGRVDPWMNAAISLSISCALCLFILWLSNHRRKK